MRLACAVGALVVANASAGETGKFNSIFFAYDDNNPRMSFDIHLFLFDQIFHHIWHGASGNSFIS